MRSLPEIKRANAEATVAEVLTKCHAKSTMDTARAVVDALMKAEAQPSSD